MAADRFYYWMALIIIAVLGYLTYQIFQPFLTAIGWAAVFCIIFYPVYGFILKHIKVKAIASLLTLSLIVMVIIGPLSYIGAMVINEATDLIQRPESGIIALKKLAADKRVTGLLEKVSPFMGMEGVSPEAIIIENTKKFGNMVVDKLSSGFTNILGLAADFIFMVFAAFFLLKDGADFLERINDFLPFSDKHKKKIGMQVKDMIVSTIYGGVVVAVVQGILGGIAFYLLGIGSSFLWGSVMSITSFIPVFGTSIVWLPASFILLLEGATAKGFALIFIGVFVISMADNILKPLIIGGRTKMPAVVIFFSVLGGLKFFGLLGLVMGPLVFALFMSVIEIFRTIEGDEAAVM